MYSKKKFIKKRRIGKYKKKPIHKGNSTLSNIASIAGTALKTAMFVKQLVNVEYKYFDQATSLATIDWNGVYAELCYPSQGIAALQRTGDSIKLKTLTLRYVWERNPAGINNEVCRIIVFLDKENNITSGAQYFANVGTVNAPLQCKNSDTKYDTKVLYDQLHYVDLYHPVTVKTMVINIDEHCHFNLGSTVIDKNCLKIMFISQSPTNGPQMTYSARTTYIDN